MKHIFFFTNIFMLLFVSNLQAGQGGVPLKNTMGGFEDCDKIIFKDHSRASEEVKVISISDEKIVYRHCGTDAGPEITVVCNDIESIVYAGGKVDHPYCKSSDSGASISSTITNNGVKTHGFALTSMIVGITAAVLALIFPYSPLMFLLGVAAIVFGGIGLWRIIKLAPKWRGRGKSITGLVTGIVAVIIFLIYWFL